MVPDFVVWDREGTRAVLVVQIGGWAPRDPAAGDPGLRQFGRRQLIDCLTKHGCRHALIVHEDESFVIRVDGDGPHPAARLPTSALLGAVTDGELLDHRVKAWLERLVGAGAEALPDDPTLQNVFVPEVARAAHGGRVVWERVEEYKRRRASGGPRYSSAQIQEMFRALEVEWERTGGFDEAHLHSFLERLHAGEAK